MTPSAFIRFPARPARRAFTSSGSEDAGTLKRSSTAVATLLTFCPPGPDARTNRSSSWSSGMLKAGVMINMACARRAYWAGRTLQVPEPESRKLLPATGTNSQV